MSDNNLPVKYKNSLPTQIKKGMIKAGKIAGSTLALLGSTMAVGISAMTFPPLAIPALGLAVYSAQKLSNNIYYTGFKDLAIMIRKHKNSVKLYQDVIRPDLTPELINMSNDEKKAFLQLQALTVLTKFDRLGSDGQPMTIETDSHGIVRSTFKDLSNMGYIDNYTEQMGKRSHLILPKLAFGNLNFGKTSQIYHMKFQKSEKLIDFEDEEFKKIFPNVFGKDGLVTSRGYTFSRGENGQIVINYNTKERRKAKNQIGDISNQIPEKTSKQAREQFLEGINVGISQEKQKENVQEILRNSKDKETIKDEEKEI